MSHRCNHELWVAATALLGTVWSACGEEQGPAQGPDDASDAAIQDTPVDEADGVSDALDASDEASDDGGLVPLPPASEAPLTTEQTLAPTHAIEPSGDPRDPESVTELLEAGFGETEVLAGEPLRHRTLDGTDAPEPGPGAAVVARFVHLADIQLADDESPVRVARLDSQSLTTGAFRPQEAYECQILNAAVRTINALDELLPLDYVVLGGDNIDNAQANELGWLHSVLEGEPLVDCDSGADDDPVPGPGNDPKDPFAPVGLSVPWLWVTGNHDILVQGNFPIDDYAEDAVGDESQAGARDWSQTGGPVVTGTVVSDSQRALLSRTELMEAVATTSDGHGIGAEQIELGKAYYVADVPDSPVRFVVVDTSAETGNAAGVVRQPDVEGFLVPALDQAAEDGKWVIVVTHHASHRIGDGSGPFGPAQDDALTSEEWVDLLGSYDNVILHLAAHSHEHGVRIMEPAGGRAYWEVRSAALSDHPHQMRLIEIRDEDNGYLTITCIGLDFTTEGDDLAAQGRRLGVLDLTSGWLGDGLGTLDDRNVVLWVETP